MSFQLKLVKPKKVKHVQAGGVRLYVYEGAGHQSTPYPSVTAILNHVSTFDYDAWAAQIGEEEARRQSKLARERGTAAHAIIENYLLNKPIPKQMPHHKMLGKIFTDIADKHITTVYGIELPGYSNHLRVGGTIDCVARWDGTIAIIDWKTAKEQKRYEWMESYYMQKAAYAVMFEELYGKPVQKLITVVACDDGDQQIVENDRDEWIEQFIAARDSFEQAA